MSIEELATLDKQTYKQDLKEMQKLVKMTGSKEGESKLPDSPKQQRASRNLLTFNT